MKTFKEILNALSTLLRLATLKADRILRWVLGGGTALVTFSLAMYFAAHASNTMLGTGPLPADVLATNSGVFEGTISWTLLSTLLFLVFAIPAALATFYATVFARLWRGKAYGMDKMSSYYAASDAGIAWSTWLWNKVRGRDLGMPLGRTVWGRPVYIPYDTLGTVIGAPGSGKTSSVVIPAVLDAPGAVSAVSHHPELIDVTRRPRDEHERRLWVFDPEDMIADNPIFTWNPIASATDETKALKIAGLFAERFRSTKEHNEAQLKEHATLLLTGLIVAAATEGHPLTEVYEWLNTKLDKPLEILSKHKDPSLLIRVKAVLDSHHGLRTVASTRAMVMCLKSHHVTRYLAGGGSKGGEARTVFDPEAFVRSSDTLYVLCSDGGNSAQPLVAMLTAAVMETALEMANNPPHYKLTKPFFAVFESAGLIKSPNLPWLYTHTPGRGIGIMTCVHSWKEGDDTYGKKFADMWDNSTYRIFTGGAQEGAFLETMSKEVGTYSFSAINRHLESRYEAVKGQTILSASALGSLPRDRALLLLRGSAPTLLRQMSWRERRDAGKLIEKMSTTTIADMNDDEPNFFSHGSPLNMGVETPMKDRLTKLGNRTKSLISRK